MNTKKTKTKNTKSLPFSKDNPKKGSKGQGQNKYKPNLFKSK